MGESKNTASTVQDIITAIRPVMSMKVIDEVKRLLTLLVVLPASTATAERSFSALRRLKTFLRSTMAAERLNSICVLHVNSDRTDELDLNDIATQFITAKDKRKAFFGL